MDDERRDWEEQLTQPEQPAPRGTAPDDTGREKGVLAAERPETANVVQDSSAMRVFRSILDVSMVVIAGAVAYVYFVQDAAPEVRAQFAVTMGGFFIVLIVLGLLIVCEGWQGRDVIRDVTHERGEIAHLGPYSGKRGILDIGVDQPFVQYHATPLTLRIRNISDSEGIRVRFHSMDHISPSSIDLPIPPGAEETIHVHVVPIAIGERDMSIELADLFDAEGRLIPKYEANTLAVERFTYFAREPAFGGITASQMRLLKTLASVATALVVGSGFILALFGEALGGMEQVIKTYVPMLVILQVPVFYVYFTLRNRLPT